MVARAEGPADEGGDVVGPVVGNAGDGMGLGVGLRGQGREDAACVMCSSGGVEG